MELFMLLTLLTGCSRLSPGAASLDDLLEVKGIPLRITPSHNRVLGIPGETPRDCLLGEPNALW